MLHFSECKDIIEQEIANIGLSEKSPPELYQPISYILNLGGKRIRPILSLMACNLFAGDVKPAISPSLAIEVFHNFTLLHDDIMDKAPLRRNKPTVHKKWNENIAILSGDAMSILAYQYLCKTNVEFIPELLTIFSQTALEICEGQQLDMNFETRNNVSINEYLDMIRLKTAVLLGSSLQIGALCGNAPFIETQKLYNFGVALGTAFQLQDDLLDTFGNEAEFGKTIGGDILANKKTFLYLKAIEISNEDQRNTLEKIYTETSVDSDKKIKNVISIFNDLNIQTITTNAVEKYTHQAMEFLYSVISPYSTKVLEKLALEIMDRKA